MSTGAKSHLQLPRSRCQTGRSNIPAALLLLLLAFPRVSAADEVLFDFTRNFDLPPPLQTTDAAVRAAHTALGSALRITTGSNQPWPGVTLPAPNRPWDLSPFARVLVSLLNSGTNSVTMHCRLDNPGADGKSHCITRSIAIEPGKTADLDVPLTRSAQDTLGGRLFGMRGYPVKAGEAAEPGTINPAEVTQLLLFVNKPSQPHSFDLLKIIATGQYTPPTAWVTDAVPYFPFIDSFGQYRHKSWPGKVQSAAALETNLQSEARQLADNSGPRGWDRFGGWAAGPKLQATGFFRVEKVRGKWWFVDPDGRLFFSHGVDCVGLLDATPIDERENWFAQFPGDQPEFAEFNSQTRALKGHYAGRTVRAFTFAGANLRRKYGPDWRNRYAAVVHQRLRSWGLNTIGNWSDASICALHLTPYTDSLGSSGARMLEGSEGYWGKFPDVFAPSFAESLRRGMDSKRGHSADDPWCIGYFSDNEMSWGDEISLALAALKSPPDQPAKIQFLADLKQSYGEIQKLNEAWKSAYASWDALLQSRSAPDPALAAADLKNFYTRFAETYFRTVRDTIKAVAPHQLYLGCRFAWVNDRAAAAAAKYCDVVSYNLYQRSVADFKFNGGADVPLLIGEFHFGALDRGMFHTGLVPVENQQARGQAYEQYVLGALRHPQFVGCHWFQYADEPTTGRVHDEENYQIGFVDVADTPYPETIAATRAVAQRVYGAVQP